MNFSFVQATIGPQLAPNPLQAVFTSPNTYGNTIVVVAFAILSGLEPDSVTDSQGNTYFLVQGAAEFGAIGLYIAPNVKAGPNTVTCADGLGIVAMEYASAISPWFVCRGSALVQTPPPSINNDNTEFLGQGSAPLFHSLQECLIVWGAEINGSNAPWTATTGSIRYSGTCPGDFGGFGTSAGDDIAADVAVSYANTILVGGSNAGFRTCVFFNLDNLTCSGGFGGLKMGLPSIDCNNPPAGSVGVPYTHSFLATFGNPPYTFAIISGSLPTGITLDPATGIASGTPTAAGTFSFTVQVTDSGSVPATASVACSIMIAGQSQRGGGGGGTSSPVVGTKTGIIPTNKTRCLAARSVPCVSDSCLSQNAKAFTKYVKTGILWRKQFPKYAGQTAPPWVKMPYDAIRLNSNGVLQFSSLTANVLTPIVTYTVPAGHYGIINQTLQVFAAQTGPQFQDGSTALKWYIGQNEAFASGFTGMNFHQGSLNSIGRVGYGAGIRMSPNQIYTYYVVSDGTPLDPEGRIICGFNGWIYPAHS